MPTKPLPEPSEPEPQPEAELAPEPTVKEGVDGLEPGETVLDSPLPSPLLTPYSGFLVPQMSFRVVLMDTICRASSFQLLSKGRYKP